MLRASVNRRLRREVERPPCAGRLTRTDWPGRPGWPMCTRSVLRAVALAAGTLVLLAAATPAPASLARVPDPAGPKAASVVAGLDTAPAPARLDAASVAAGIAVPAPAALDTVPLAQPRTALTYELAETWSDVPRPTQAGHFIAPLDISSIPDGTVLVLGQAFGLADPVAGIANDGAVHELAPDGTPRDLLALGRYFQSVRRLDGGFDGTFHVLGRLNPDRGGTWAVMQLTPAGALTQQFDQQPTGVPIDVAVSGPGNVYVTVAAAPARIDVYGPDGVLFDEIIPDQMAIGGADDPYRYALTRLDVGPDGVTYVMAVAQRNCPPGPPGPPTRPPPPTPTPRPSLAGGRPGGSVVADGRDTGRSLAPAAHAVSGDHVDQAGLPCAKNIVLIFEPDHSFREEVPNAHTTDIAAGVSGVFVSKSSPGFRRPAQRVYELFSQEPALTYRVPDSLEIPIPYSAPEMQLDIGPGGDVFAATNLGGPFYRGAVALGDPAAGRGMVSGPQAALGMYDQPGLGGPMQPRRIDAGAEVLLLEGAYQAYGTDGRHTTSVDVRHDMEAIQSWSLAGVPQRQVVHHDQLLRDGAEGSDLYLVLAPLMDIGLDGTDIYAISGQIVWHRPDALPPLWYRHVPGAYFVAVSADAGRAAVLNAAVQRVLVLDRDGDVLYDKPITQDSSKRLASDLALAGDRVYLADQGRNTVMIRGIDGRDLGEWPTHDGPYRIAVAPDGDVVILGRGGYGLRYSPTGELRAAWRMPTQHGGVPVDPFDIAVGDDGRVYVNFIGLSDPAPGSDLPGPVWARGYDVNAGGVWVFEPVEVPEPNVPLPGQRACVIARPLKQSVPTVILLGEEIRLTLRVDGLCPGQHMPQQLVVVLDTSYSMHDLFYEDYEGPGALRRAKDVMTALLSSIDPANIEIALVTFSGGAGMEVPLPGELGLVRSRIVTRRADGDTQMGTGIKLAHSELIGPRGNRSVKQTILIVSDGLFKDDPQPAIAAAMADGIEVVAVVMSTPGFDAVAQARLEAVIGGKDRIFVDPIPETARRVIDHVSAYVPNPGLFETITIDDIVPGNMRYIDGSAEPPAVFDDASRTLRWSLGPVAAADGVALTYRLQPAVPGTWPTNVEARARYRDALGNDGELVFPVPAVLVLAPNTISTPTAVPPTPTPTPTVTPTRKPNPTTIYLPYGERPPICIRKVVNTDVVLALDMSTSMYRDTSAGRSKHAAAIQAAKLFVDQLQLEPQGDGRLDQVAIVGFNDRAWTATSLTYDRATIDAALDGLLADIREGTRLDLVFDTAQRELASPLRRGENQPALVLLTDGLPNWVPTPVPAGGQEVTVLAAATRVKANGTMVYTIGLGWPEDIWPWLLQQAASDPTMYYYAPDGEDLALIYWRILVRLVCP